MNFDMVSHVLIIHCFALDFLRCPVLYFLFSFLPVPAGSPARLRDKEKTALLGGAGAPQGELGQEHRKA